ncbi:jg15587 [Pararge aegeria aegeria]|uniref:Jg15587 protein n=1 Tax=Pararge aegeria aegeria TaxID=348720 RepID=A0A8S4RVZ3_9NEOP|nr:jg15587 [Pararge aegeria aegeria]
MQSKMVAGYIDREYGGYTPNRLVGHGQALLILSVFESFKAQRWSIPNEVHSVHIKRAAGRKQKRQKPVEFRIPYKRSMSIGRCDDDDEGFK